MMRSIRKTLFSLAGVCLLCPALAAAPSVLGAEPLTLSQDGQTVSLAVGQEFTVHLEANWTTGYAWFLSGFTEDTLAREGDRVYRQDPGAAGRIGAGGVEIWRFKAVRTGTQTLCFEYRRSWEGAVSPARKASYILQVR